ncbi:hypothetical protein Agub_g8300 [Astrephomene gubernaculifera]|uniref:fructose-bisphosphate aldolase n=1 Tax=Astrephomene gubernaculifera TaxID=47775 RepID=A0AAD3DTD1_9CHLO|nr:hypothetical protein Agub_g8300 [Astrephomene gubernaculifera]
MAKQRPAAAVAAATPPGREDAQQAPSEGTAAPAAASAASNSQPASSSPSSHRQTKHRSPNSSRNDKKAPSSKPNRPSSTANPQTRATAAATTSNNPNTPNPKSSSTSAAVLWALLILAAALAVHWTSTGVRKASQPPPPNTALREVARLLLHPEKGILAADESPVTFGKRLLSYGLPNNASVRRQWRRTLLTTPGLQQYISGVILHPETLSQLAPELRAVAAAAVAASPAGPSEGTGGPDVRADSGGGNDTDGNSGCGGQQQTQQRQFLLGVKLDEGTAPLQPQQQQGRAAAAGAAAAGPRGRGAGGGTGAAAGGSSRGSGSSSSTRGPAGGAGGGGSGGAGAEETYTQGLEGLATRCRRIRDALTTAPPMPAAAASPGTPPQPSPASPLSAGTSPPPGSPSPSAAAAAASSSSSLVSFAKWRAVFRVGRHTPSSAALRRNAHDMAAFAAVTQKCGLLPVLEPEVLSEGDHDLQRAMGATARVLKGLFRALRRRGDVDVGALLLKVAFVTPGEQHGGHLGVTPEQVANATLRVLFKTVPRVVPGILFLSGGQGEAAATAHLLALGRLVRERELAGRPPM